MRRNKSFILLGLVLYAANAIAGGDKMTVGWIEPVTIMSGEMNFLAKLDTGADSSSLNASDIKIIDREGTEYVQFNIKSRDGDKQSLEMLLIDRAVIKRHFTAAQERPVVMMSICLGDHAKKVPVNLVDRSKFNYQVLLGRTFLAPNFVVDSARKNSTKPRCEH